MNSESLNQINRDYIELGSWLAMLNKSALDKSSPFYAEMARLASEQLVNELESFRNELKAETRNFGQ